MWHPIITFGLAHTVRRRRAWHAIVALGRQTCSDNVRRDKPSPPLDSTHGRTTSSVVLYHRPWTARTVGQRRAWHDIIALGHHTRSNDVGCGMTSPPLDCMHGRTTLGMAYHHRLSAAHTIERRWALHAIITFGQHKQSNDVGRGMTSSPFDCTYGRTTSGVA